MAFACVLLFIVRLEERELSRRFGPAHAKYATSVPDLFFPVPFLLLPAALRAKRAEDEAATKAREKEATVEDVRDELEKTRSSSGSARSTAAVPVERAFADDITEDAVPEEMLTPKTELRDSIGGTAARPNDGDSPDPFAFDERDIASS